MHDRKRNPLSPPLSCCAAVLRQLQKQQLIPNCHPRTRIEATVRTCYPTRRIWAMLMLMLPRLLYFHIDQIPQWTRHMPCSVKGVRPFFFCLKFSSRHFRNNINASVQTGFSVGDYFHLDSRPLGRESGPVSGKEVVLLGDPSTLLL